MQPKAQRAPGSHRGTISLLLSTAMQNFIALKLRFDFDGFANASSCNSFSGFGEQSNKAECRAVQHNVRCRASA